MTMNDPAHPGEVLREYLPPGMSVSEAAKRLKVSRQALSALLNARSDMSASRWPCVLKPLLEFRRISGSRFNCSGICVLPEKTRSHPSKK